MDEVIRYELEHNAAGKEVDEELHMFDEAMTEMYPMLDASTFLMMLPLIPDAVSYTKSDGVELINEKTGLPRNNVAYFELANSGGVPEYRAKKDQITYTDPTMITKNRTLLTRLVESVSNTILKNGTVSERRNVVINNMNDIYLPNTGAINEFVRTMAKTRKRLALVKFVQRKMIEQMMKETTPHDILQRQCDFTKQNGIVLMYTLIKALNKLIDDSGDDNDAVITFIRRWVSITAFKIKYTTDSVSRNVSEILQKNRIKLDTIVLDEDTRKSLLMSDWNRIFSKIDFKPVSQYRRDQNKYGSIGNFENLLSGMSEIKFDDDDGRSVYSMDDVSELSNVIPVEKIFDHGVKNDIMSSVQMTVNYIREINLGLIMAVLDVPIRTGSLQMFKLLIDSVHLSAAGGGGGLSDEKLRDLMNLAIELDRSTIVNYMIRTLGVKSDEATKYLSTVREDKQTYAERITGFGDTRTAVLKDMGNDK